VAVKSLERRLIGWEYRETGTGHMIPNVWNVNRNLFVMYQITLSIHQIM
jgi:hypothetical protein